MSEALNLNCSINDPIVKLDDMPHEKQVSQNEGVRKVHMQRCRERRAQCTGVSYTVNAGLSKHYTNVLQKVTFSILYICEFL